MELDFPKFSPKKIARSAKIVILWNKNVKFSKNFRKIWPQKLKMVRLVWHIPNASRKTPLGTTQVHAVSINVLTD